MPGVERVHDAARAEVAHDLRRWPRDAHRVARAAGEEDGVGQAELVFDRCAYPSASL